MVFGDNENNLPLKTLNSYSIDPANLLVSGAAYRWSDTIIALANGASSSYSFQTASLPVYLYSVDISVNGTRDVLIQNFFGGAVSGGTEITDVLPRNHFQQIASPYMPNSVFRSRTIDTPGVIISTGAAGQQDRSTSSVSGGGLILQPNNLYYLTITNNEQSANITTSIIAAAMVSPS